MTVQRARYFFCGLLLFTTILVSGQGGTKIISAGSYIVDMGQEPQTIENSLKPYGLVYELVSEFQVPVLWSIKPDKSYGDADFSIGNTAYAGGPFIIEAEYLDNDVNAVIDTWEAKGVSGEFINQPVNVPVYQYIVSVPKMLFGNFGGNSFTNPNQYVNINAEITNWLPITSFNNPDICADLAIIGDEDLVNSDISGIYDFVSQGGNLILQGRSVSTIAALSDGGNTLDFLTDGRLFCYADNECGTAPSHDPNATEPFNYDPVFAENSIMQVMTTNIHLAIETESISESWYLPLTEWNVGTAQIINTADQNPIFDNTFGAMLAYGRAYGNSNFGNVLFVGGEDLNSGTAGDVAAQRVLLNFILQTGIDKSGTAQLQNFDQPLVAGTGQTVSTTINGITPQRYTWRSNCGGSIQGNTNEIIFTPENTNRRYECDLSVVATDECGRSAFETTSFTVFPINGEPQPGEDDVLTNGATPLTIEVLENDSDPQPDDALIISRILAQPVNGSVSISNNQLIYTGNDDEYIADSLYYEVCDDGIPSLCAEARVLITNELQLNTAPIVEDQTFEIIAGQNTDICITATDNEGDELEITELNYDGPGELVNANPNDLCFKFLIEEPFTVDQIVTVEICDIRENFLCTTAVITLTNIPDPEPEIIVSKALTPNNDGDNDSFVIQGINAYPENRVMIYDRWGGVVFETQGYQNVNNFWDGQNGSREAPAGTYFYVIDLPGTGQQFKGYVELVK